MKLTNEMRDQVIAKILKEKFRKQEELQSLAKFTFSDECYFSIAGHEELAKLPESWFYKSQQFTGYFNGERMQLCMSVGRHLPYSIYNSGLRFTLDHPLTQKRIVMKQQAHNLEMAISALRSELKKTLYSVNTDKRLIAIWPEAVKWLPSPTASYPPANVDITKLRSLLEQPC